ncbi:MAG TPA: GNAT family N-acetyltransferase [Mucilaginibacter sp.]|nr:GNAT family N-acetyltransferase [Mucilaginibacter sp.]
MSDNIEIKGYHIERLSRKNIHSLNMLHDMVYGKPHEADYFVKKYDTAYTGVEYTGYIAYDEKELPIAYYGVIPCFVRDNDRLYLAAQSADTMTHPKYRFKGLFVQLANLTFDLCTEEGVSIIFGFPNQNSLHGFLSKLKWQMTETMDCYIIPVGTIPAEGIAHHLPFLDKMYKAYQQQVLKKYLLPQKGIENSAFKDGFAGVNRNALYLNYKTYHDTFVIRIGDSLLWIKIKHGLIIGDINCREEDFDGMMHELHKIALKLGLTEIQFHTSHQTTLSALFAARYDAVPSFHVLFKEMGGHIPLDKIKFTFADVDTF